MNRCSFLGCAPVSLRVDTSAIFAAYYGFGELRHLYTVPVWRGTTSTGESRHLHTFAASCSCDKHDKHLLPQPFPIRWAELAAACGHLPISQQDLLGLARTC